MASRNSRASPTLAILTPIDRLMPRSYVIGSLLFIRTSRRAIPYEIYKHLNQALEDTIQEIPFLGGRICPVEGQIGQYEIRSHEDEKRVPLIFNDMTSRSNKLWKHSFKSLSKDNFPVELMDLETLSPVNEYMQMKEPPVLGAQANFIDGGLILFSTVIHTACDALAWFNFVKIWASKSKANWDPDSEDNGISVTSDMLDRRPLMQGNANVTRGDVREFKLQTANESRVEATLIDAKPTSATEMRMGMFSISKSKMAGLRDVVSATDGWVTINEALAAFLWMRVNHARFSDPGAASKPPSGNLAVAVDGRLQLEPPLPLMYMGNSALAFPITLNIHQKSMGVLAVSIRNAMADFTNKHLRDVIGYLSSIGDVTEERIKYARTVNPTLVISNLKDMSFANIDWGAGLGFIETCRPLRPFGDCIPRAIPLLTHKNGDIEIMVWIEKQAMERLKVDPEWCKWATFVSN